MIIKIFGYIKESLINSENKRILLILLAGLSIRLIIAFKMGPWRGSSHDVYDKIASSLIAGKGFSLNFNTPDIYFQPIYPFFIAFWYFLLGKHPLIVCVIQAIISSFTAIFIYCIGRELFDKRVGLISMIIFSFYPYSAFLDTALTDMSIFTFFLVLSIFSLLKVVGNHTWHYQTLAGLSLGLATLTRATILPFLPFIAFWLLIVFDYKKAIQTILFLTFFVSIVIIPWTIRNYFVSGSFVPITVAGKSGLWHGNNEYIKDILCKGRSVDFIRYPYPMTNGHPPKVVVENSNKYYDDAITFIKKNPREVLQLAAIKFMIFWDWNYFPRIVLDRENNNPEGVPVPNLRLRSIAYALSYRPVLLFGILGMILSYRNWRKTTLLLFLLCSFTLSHMIIFGFPRYRLPLDSFLAIFSAYAIVEIVDKIKTRLSLTIP